MTNLFAAGLDKNEILGDTKYTLGFITDKLLHSSTEFQELSKNGQIKDAKAVDISGGKGFMSNVFKLTFTFDNDEELTFIMKVPTPELLSNVKETEVFNDLTHQCECAFLEAVREVRGLPVPRVHHTQLGDGRAPGCILMEDLSRRATSVPFFEHLPAGLCRDMARQLARFHARLAHLPAGRVRVDVAANESLLRLFAELFAKYLPQGLLDLDPTLKPLLDQCMVLASLEFQRFCQTGVLKDKSHELLCHGDCHSNNIMFKVNPDGSLSNSVQCLIDFQTLFFGNSLLDLGRFLCFNVESPVRREVERECVDLYYDTLCGIYAEEGRQKVPFGRVECHLYYDYAFMQQAIGLAISPSFFVDPHYKMVTDVAQPARDAQLDHLLVRTKHALQDAAQLMDKHGIQQKFGKFAN